LVGIYLNSVSFKSSSTPVLLIVSRSLGSLSSSCERRTEVNSYTICFSFASPIRRRPSIVLDWPVGFCFGLCRGVEGGRWRAKPPLRVLKIVVWPDSRGSFGRMRGVGAILKLVDRLKLNWKFVDGMKLNW
jgi:hypothetical protein